MVEHSKDASKEHIGSSSLTGLDADPTTARPENFKMVQEVLYNEYAQKVSKAKDR
jgi:hypothetical protein